MAKLARAQLDALGALQQAIQSLVGVVDQGQTQTDASNKQMVWLTKAIVALTVVLVILGAGTAVLILRTAPSPAAAPLSLQASPSSVSPSP